MDVYSQKSKIFGQMSSNVMKYKNCLENMPYVYALYNNKDSYYIHILITAKSKAL